MLSVWLLAFVSGVVSILSPCILPMLPIVTAEALRSSRWSLAALAAGLMCSFALVGTFLTYLFLQLNISTSWLRYVSAVFLLFFAFIIFYKPASQAMSVLISRLLAILNVAGGSAQATNGSTNTIFPQFLIGFSLGAVWLPCVGPTLGSAIALASFGEQMFESFIVLLFYGAGAGISLVVVGSLASKILAPLKLSARKIQLVLAVSLSLVALMVLTGFDKVIEAALVQYLPTWMYSL